MRTRDQKGFSMIEMLLSLGLMMMAMAGLASMLIQNSRVNKAQQMTAEVQANARNCLSMIVQDLRGAGWNPMNVAGMDTVITDQDLGDGISEIEVFADLDEDLLTDSLDEQVLIRHVNNQVVWRRTNDTMDPFVVLANNISNDADGDGTVEPMFVPDVPPTVLTSFDGGRYIAFMTNDPLDTRTSPIDNNDRVMITGIGAGPDRTVEVVQAIVERVPLFPELPAAITILGEQNCGTDCAFFEGGTSTPKTYTGDDTGSHCSGGVPGLNVPVIGVIGGSSVTTTGTGVHKPLSYQSGGATGTTTISDLTTTGTLAPLWQNCTDIIEFARLIRSMADVIGNSSLPEADLGTPGNGKIVFIEGDYDINGGFSGEGVLFVTGYLEFSGNADWEGPIFAIGEGDFERDGAGNGVITGGILVADVSGPDRVLFTGDDCVGQDGVGGTADDGIAQGTFDVSGGGTGTTGYCSAALRNWQARRPLDIVSYIQH